MSVETEDMQRGFRFPVAVEIYPGRLLSMMKMKLEDVRTDEASRRARWDYMVSKGLRAQLRTGNLITGQLYVAMDVFPDAPKAEIDWTHTPPVVPTVPGGLDELQATLTSIAKKIDKLPIDEIGTDARQSLASLNRTLNSTNKFVTRLDAEVTPAAKSALDEVRQTLKMAEQTLAADSPTQHELQETLRELNRTAQSLRLLSEYLERHPEALIRGKKEGGR